MDIAVYVFIILSLIALLVSFLQWKRYAEKKEELKSHLKELAIHDPLYGVKKKESFREKLLVKALYFADDFSSLGHRINFFSESQDVERWLMQAGYPYALTTSRFQGLKIFLLALGFFMGVASFIFRLPFSQFAIILFPVFGYFSVILWIKQKAKQRQAELSFALPDFLDTMSVTLQAGVALDKALREIIRYFEGPLEDEMKRFLQETDLGVPRERAYQNLLSRNDSFEFQSVIKSLIQGERLGVPISQTFKTQAEEMRKHRKEKVKETAAKASPKITLITTFIVMPSAMLLVGGLMIMNMFSTNSNLFDLFK